MLKKLRIFFISFLLVPVLTMNANAYTADANAAAFNPPQQSMCWVYFAHTWWLLPC